MNAREGIKTNKCPQCGKELIMLKTMNAREGIKTGLFHEGNSPR